MPLTDTAIKNAKRPPHGKPKLFDGDGLFLLVPKEPTRNKAWRLKYRFGGQEKLLAIGTYPEVSLADARKAKDAAREQLKAGIDPGAKRKAEKAEALAIIEAEEAAAIEREENTFEAVAREWFGKHSPNWAASHGDKIIRRLERDVFPWLGQRPIREIEPPELLACLRRIEERGALETAHRAHQNCGQIFRYAVATGRTARDPSGDLKGAIPPAKEKHHASITDPKAIGELLRAMESYKGSLITRCALKLSALVFVRPGELRRAEWSEINFDTAEWRIPAHKMKARAIHIVPLSNQALEILGELKPLTGQYKYLFPGVRDPKRPMSEITVLAALRRMGYGKEEMTAHGFRSMASTLLNEQGWHHDAIERQLAHAERNNVRAAYNYAEYLPERKRMMQAWADHLDGLRKGADVVSINSKRA